MLGRLDDVVITGGLNVDLAEVEGLVREWAERTGADAVVVGIPDAEWGTKIVAVTDGRGELPELQQMVRRSLPAYAAPRALVCLNRLPRLASGKPDRRAIRALVARGDGRWSSAPDERSGQPGHAGAVAGRSPAANPAGRGRPRGRRVRPGLLRGSFRPAAALLALVVSLALQVGVNYANDYSDGIRGTDAVRVGPLRLVGSGLAAPGAVKRAALVSFAVAGLAGLGLVIMTGQWWLLAVGVACVLAAWYYTGGRRPYGYLGLGEVFVFVFFGLVAVCGTVYVQVGRVGWATLLTGVASVRWPARSWWPTTCATSPETAARASAHWPPGWVRGAPGCSTPDCPHWPRWPSPGSPR